MLFYLRGGAAPAGGSVKSLFAFWSGGAGAVSVAPTPTPTPTPDTGAGAGRKRKPDEQPWVVVERPVFYKQTAKVEDTKLTVEKEEVEPFLAYQVAKSSDLQSAIDLAEQRIEALRAEYEANQAALAAKRTKRALRRARSQIEQQRALIVLIQEQIQIIDAAYIEAMRRDEEDAIVALLMTN